MTKPSFRKLIEYIKKIPSVIGSINTGFKEDLWWIQFQIDIDHKLAWEVIQEFGFILNYLSINERIPTIFMPVSPSPYLNGGPHEYLSWVIKSTSKKFSPDDTLKVLKERLPNPVKEIGK